MIRLFGWDELVDDLDTARDWLGVSGVEHMDCTDVLWSLNPRRLFSTNKDVVISLMCARLINCVFLAFEHRQCCSVDQCVLRVQCGWCLAISSTKKKTRKRGRETISRCVCVTGRLASCFAICIVIGLLASLFTFGLLSVLPNMFQATLLLASQQAVVLFICFNVAFNYLGCALKSPGVPSQVAHRLDLESGQDSVPQGAYDQYRYCVVCKTPKPPGAHHCSICRKCILDMDHHCPFIGNCVGRLNLRSFILFLTWTLIGTIYGMIVTGALLLRSMGTMSLPKKTKGFSILGLLFSSIDAVPWWYFATMYVFVVCIGSFLAVGALLQSQIAQVIRGQSYINILKGETAERKLSAHAQIKRLCGGRNMWLWLLPFWSIQSHCEPMTKVS